MPSSNQQALARRGCFSRNPLCFLLILTIAATLTAALRSFAMMGKAAPEITGANWLNTKPLNITQLKGRVVLVEFWTYG